MNEYDIWKGMNTKNEYEYVQRMREWLCCMERNEICIRNKFMQGIKRMNMLYGKEWVCTRMNRNKYVQGMNRNEYVQGMIRKEYVQEMNRKEYVQGEDRNDVMWEK